MTPGGNPASRASSARRFPVANRVDGDLANGTPNIIGQRGRQPAEISAFDDTEALRRPQDDLLAAAGHAVQSRKDVGDLLLDEVHHLWPRLVALPQSDHDDGCRKTALDIAVDDLCHLTVEGS